MVRTQLMLLRWKIKMHYRLQSLRSMSKRFLGTSGFHVLMMLVVLGFGIYWHRHPPTPNKALLVFSFIAAITMFFRLKRWHKAIYILILIGLLVIENHALDLDRTTSEERQSAQRLEEDQSFQRLLEKAQGILKNQNELYTNTINELTGGNSYVLVTPVLVPDKLGRFPIIASVIGKNDISDVSIDIMRLPVPANIGSPEFVRDYLAGTNMTVERMGDLSREWSKPLFHTLSASEEGITEYSVGVFARNGITNERMRFRKRNGLWQFSYRVIREGSGVHPKAKVLQLTNPEWVPPMPSDPQ